MANLQTLGAGQQVSLAAAQVGNGVSTNVVQRRGDTIKATLIRLVTTIGATPTCTYLFEASPDGIGWFSLPMQDITSAGPPGALTSASIGAITTATTKWFWVPVDFPWIFLRVTFSANTNVTNTVDVWVY